MTARPTPSITFYSVPERGYDREDYYTGRDKSKLLAFLANEGTEDMRVIANGVDVTMQIARELADLSGQTGEYECGFDSTFSPFAQHFAGPRCTELWADIERQHFEDIQYGTRFAGDRGYA